MKKKIQDPQFTDIYIFNIAFIGMDKYPTNHKVKLIIYKNGEIEFEILKFIGEGSFGHVYLSRNLQTDKLVCLKVFKRYKTYTMEHIGFNYMKNLLPDNKSTPEFFYSGFDKVSEKYIIIMEYIEGPLLKDVLPTIKEPKIILSLLKQMLEIVGTLGKVGLIHRDIKESNVIWVINGMATIVVLQSDYHSPKPVSPCQKKKWSENISLMSQMMSSLHCLCLYIAYKRYTSARSQ